MTSPPESHKPTNEVPPKAPDRVPTPVDWLWSRIFPTRMGRGVFTVVALVTITASFGTAVGTISKWRPILRGDDAQTIATWPAQPAILYVYPDLEFGILRRDGFEAGTRVAEAGKALHVQRVEASFDSLKAGSIGEIKEAVARWLASQSVAAVVAPSVTEATRPIIDLVRATHPKLPIIIESSIDPRDLQWTDSSRWFRLSSGVDARGYEIGLLMDSLMQRGRNVVVIAEDRPETYGGKIFKYAHLAAPAIQGVPQLSYRPGRLSSTLAELGGDIQPNFDQRRVLDALTDSAAVVFFLGVGNDFKALVDYAYREDSATRATAKLVGVMNAYVLEELYREGSNTARSDLIFDITDFDFSNSASPATAAAFIEAFAPGGVLTPALRDQAFSFDAAVVLVEAIKHASGSATYNEGVEKVYEYLANYSKRGITGSIVLSGPPKQVSARGHVPAGQNAGSSVLRISRYDRRIGKWVIENSSVL